MKTSITPIDCQYIQPRFAAAYLMQDQDQAAFIETNTAHAAPLLLQALNKQGLKPEQVKYIIITHVHLDHAGGTSALIKKCPNAIVLAHPRATPHLIDPSKLVSSAKKVYGEATFEKLYGQIEPIDATRVRSMNDGETLAFGHRTLQFIHTRGHANHHFCIFDSGSQSIFTGDSFGLAYPDLQSQGLFIFPSTSPTDFDANEARISIQKILASGATSAYLTHFDRVTSLQEAAQQLLDHIDFSECLLESAIRLEPNEQLSTFCRDAIFTRFKKIFQDKNWDPSGPLWNLIQMDLELNADGIAYVAQKKRSKLTSSSP